MHDQNIIKLVNNENISFEQYVIRSRTSGYLEYLRNKVDYLHERSQAHGKLSSRAEGKIWRDIWVNEYLDEDTDRLWDEWEMI